MIIKEINKGKYTIQLINANDSYIVLFSYNDGMLQYYEHSDLESATTDYNTVKDIVNDIFRIESLT